MSKIPNQQKVKKLHFVWTIEIKSRKGNSFARDLDPIVEKAKQISHFC